MSERKKLKRKLARLKQFKNNLPILIDCSEVYGDVYFTQKDMSKIDKEIQEIETLIKNI